MAETDDSAPKRRLLIVDDDQEFAESITDILIPEGYEPIIADRPETAALALKAHTASVALIDVRLRGLSGVELLARLKAERPDLVVVMMTAHADTQTAINALRQGAYDYCEYPLPPLTPILASEMFAAAARNAGYHPFPRPSANASQPYTNPDGSKFGGCQYCGYCQRFGCEANAKGSPHMTVIPIAMARPNFELRTNCWVTQVLKDSDGKRVTGVTYTNVLNGEEFEQPATIVLLCAYAINNVHLMLLSGIGTPYDPVAQKGVIGKNYCYQTGASATLFFDGKYFNPFMNAGGSNASIDDFNTNWAFDRSPHDFVGGYTVAGGFNTPLPIGYRPVPSGTPQWGSEWKRATAKWYQTAMVINASGSVMAHRYNCYDLDSTYRNAFGQPLMRMTFDYKANEHKMGIHAAQTINTIANSMNPTKLNPAVARTNPWTVVPYQSTHNTGGTIMGTNPRDSALNKYLQSWDCHNLFVVGANVFPHNSSYNPTGPVGALAYWTADAIKNRYLKNPAPLVQA